MGLCYLAHSSELSHPLHTRLNSSLALGSHNIIPFFLLNGEYVCISGLCLEKGRSCFSSALGHLRGKEISMLQTCWLQPCFECVDAGSVVLSNLGKH